MYSQDTTSNIFNKIFISAVNYYRYLLQMAISHQCQPIAFPAISCGIYQHK
ncbi:TPA: macro domain-containing protein [Photobacterium damselae]